MNEFLEFLNKRVHYLRGFDEEIDDLKMDGEEIFSAGVEDGRFKEAMFIRDKVKELLSK